MTTAVRGDLEAQITGNIIATSLEGDITTTATKGDISATSTEGDITVTTTDTTKKITLAGNVDITENLTVAKNVKLLLVQLLQVRSQLLMVITTHNLILVRMRYHRKYWYFTLNSGINRYMATIARTSNLQRFRFYF